MEKLSAVNIHLGGLICCSCRRHNSFSSYDKVFLLPDWCEIRVHSNGKIEFYGKSGENEGSGRNLIQEAAALSQSNYQTCGEGITVALRNSKMECASCVDEVFLTPDK